MSDHQIKKEENVIKNEENDSDSTVILHTSKRCPICFRTFKTIYSLIRHRKTIDCSIYKCATCGKKINTPKRITIHKRKHHILERQNAVMFKKI